MAEARMDGTAYEAALFRIEALREALGEIGTMDSPAARAHARNAIVVDNERAQRQHNKETDEASYADLRASGGIVGAP